MGDQINVELESGEKKETNEIKEILEIFQIQDEQEREEAKTKWTEERLSKLESQRLHEDSRVAGKVVAHKPENNFIHPESQVKFSPALNGRFKLNDKEIYKLFLNKLENYYKKNFKEKNNIPRLEFLTRFHSFDAIVDTLSAYFGIANKETLLNHRKLEETQSNMDAKTLNLEDFKKEKNNAMCSQRSAISHNLLKFVGIDSTYMATKANITGVPEGHSYIVFKLGTKYGIFDPTNPVQQKYQDKEGKIFPYSKAAMYQISEEDYAKILDTETPRKGIKVEHSDKFYVYNSEKETYVLDKEKKETRVYSLPLGN